MRAYTLALIASVSNAIRINDTTTTPTTQEPAALDGPCDWAQTQEEKDLCEDQQKLDKKWEKLHKQQEKLNEAWESYYTTMYPDYHEEHEDPCAEF